jgi:hypothetical protein
MTDPAGRQAVVTACRMLVKHKVLDRDIDDGFFA